MKRALTVLALVAAGCHDFDSRLADCIDAGQCTDGTGSVTPQLVFDADPAPAEVDFQDVVVGQPKTVMVRLRNKGSQPTSAINTELNSTEFVKGTDGCDGKTLAGRATCDIEVTLIPSLPGTRLATLTAQADPGGTVNVKLTGNGVLGAALTLQPNQVDFGPRTINTLSMPTRVTVRNTGTVAAASVAVQLTGAGMGAFGITGNTCTTLGGAMTCDVDLVFHPTAVGAVSAALEVSAAGVPMVSAPLNGIGLALSDLNIAPSMHAFGIVATGRSASQHFTVTNAGTAATSAVTTQVIGANTSHYALVGNTCSGSTLPVSGSCGFDVVFSPTALGSLPATVTVSATTGGTSTLDLTGTGLAPARLVLAPLNADFGTLDAGQSASRPFTLKNIGEEQSEPISFQLTAPASFSFDGGTCFGVRLGNDAGCDFAVRYAPVVQENNATGSLAVGADAGGVTVLPVHGIGRVAFTLQVTFTTPRSGSIDIPGQPSCTVSPCLYVFDQGTVVNISAKTPHPGWTTIWGGCDVGTCQVTLNANRNVFAGIGGNNLAFVTSGTFNPNFGGLAGGDGICNNVAIDAGLPGTYRAFLSQVDAGVSALNRLPMARGGWLRTDGRWLVLNREDLFSSGTAFFSPLDSTERGVTVSPYSFFESAFTGTFRDGGAVPGGDCSGWTSTSAGVEIGYIHSLSSTWVDGFGAGCSAQHLYCFEVDQAVAGLYRAPIPDGGRIAFVSQGGRAGGSGTHDLNCQMRATAAMLPGSYKALLRIGSNPASSRFRLDGGAWYRLDGRPAFASPNDLTSATPPILPAPFMTEQSGMLLSTHYVWTGAPGPGSPGGGASNCGDWASAAGVGMAGSPGTVDTQWWNANSPLCDGGVSPSTTHDYCLQE